MSIITDHALLRYLERICGLNIRELKKKAAKMGYLMNDDHCVLAFIQKEEGIDIEATRKSLITSKLLGALKIGARSVKINGATFIIQAQTVVTVYSEVSTVKPKALKPVMKKGAFKSVRKPPDYEEAEADA